MTFNRSSVELTHLDKVCKLGVSCSYEPVDFVLDLAFITLLDGDIPLRETSLALAILKKKEANLRYSYRREGGGEKVRVRYREKKNVEIFRDFKK
jgi:hypothetical protein